MKETREVNTFLEEVRSWTIVINLAKQRKLKPKCLQRVVVPKSSKLVPITGFQKGS